MPGNHAFLSPSSAVRWYFCPPSARLCEQFPDQGSIFMAEGTEAHSLCEYLLKSSLGIPCVDPRPSLQFYCPDMEEAAQGYVQYILEKVERYKAEMSEASAETKDVSAESGEILSEPVSGSAAPAVFVEQRLDLREYIPQSMGTADCVIVAGDTVEIIDFKYGMHRVPATSVQLRIYALGACEVFSSLYEFSRVRMAIYQPRLSSVDEAEMTVAELYEWAASELAPRARQAFDGVGEFACGDWCRICRARHNCRALAEHMLEIAKSEFAPPALLSDAEIAEVLSRADSLAAWASDVRDYALSCALKGHTYPGFKVVAGRSVRRFSDDAEVAARLERVGRNPWEKKLMGVTALEKQLGKKEFASLLSDLVSRSPGKPVLVPVADERPELKTAEQEFAGSAVCENKESEDFLYE